MSVRLGAKIASVILAVAAVAAVVITAPRADETAQPAAGSAGAANDGRQAVNKPVITDKMLTEAAKAAPADPLHRHPTLLRMLFRNNTVRNRFGLRSHRVHPALTKAAQDHANYMARTGDFSHYSNLGPSGRASKYGFRYGVMENIAYGYSSIEAAFAAWQASGGHWANMSSNSSVAGFGFAKSSNGTTYWVAMYGTAPASESEAITEAALITTAPTVGGANAAAPAGAGQSTSGPPASGPPASGDTPPASEAEADAGNDDSVTTSSGNSGSNRRRLLFRRR